MFNFSNLPTDLQVKIIQNLDTQSIINLSWVSKSFYDAIFTIPIYLVLQAKSKFDSTELTWDECQRYIDSNSTKLINNFNIVTELLTKRMILANSLKSYVDKNGNTFIHFVFEAIITNVCNIIRAYEFVFPKYLSQTEIDDQIVNIFNRNTAHEPPNKRRRCYSSPSEQTKAVISQALIESSRNFVRDRVVAIVLAGKNLIDHIHKGGYPLNIKNNNGLEPITHFFALHVLINNYNQVEKKMNCNCGSMEKKFTHHVRKVEEHYPMIILKEIFKPIMQFEIELQQLIEQQYSHYYPGRKYVPDVTLFHNSSQNKTKKYDIPNVDEELQSLDQLPLTIHQRLALTERTIYHCFYSPPYSMNVFGQNLAVANISFVLLHSVNQEMKLFITIPLYEDNILIKSQFSEEIHHSERRLCEYFKKKYAMIINKLGEKLEKQKGIDLAETKVYAIIMDIYSTREVCLNCDSALHDLQINFSEEIKKYLSSRNFKVPKNNLPIIIRLGGTCSVSDANDGACRQMVLGQLHKDCYLPHPVDPANYIKEVKAFNSGVRIHLPPHAQGREAPFYSDVLASGLPAFDFRDETKPKNIVEAEARFNENKNFVIRLNTAFTPHDQKFSACQLQPKRSIQKVNPNDIVASYRAVSWSSRSSRPVVKQIPDIASPWKVQPIISSADLKKYLTKTKNFGSERAQKLIERIFNEALDS